MLLPHRGNKELSSRGDSTVELAIKTSLTLRAGQKHVEVNVEFDNCVEDHYLRAMFPTGLSGADHADSVGHFTVDRRPVRPQGPTEDSIWPDMATQPMGNFLDLSDGKCGLAFLSDSLIEYEVLDNQERTVALSLLRAVRNWICTETRVGSSYPSQKGGQCLGRHSFRYAIMPHEGNWQDANVPLAAERFIVPVLPVQTRAHGGTLPQSRASFLEIDNPALRISAVKRAEVGGNFVVRMYNPTARTQKGSLICAAGLAGAWRLRLDEQRDGEIAIADAKSVSVTAGPFKIVTVELQLIGR
jgi:mannosylglycerate hydrolase